MNKACTLRLTSSSRGDITSIELRGDAVDDSVMARLFAHQKLRELHIVDAKNVTNAGLTYIENLRSLEWLNLDGVAINDKGLLFLRQMTKLRGLHLTNAFLTGCGIEHLQALKSLEYLDLNGTNIDDDSLRKLSKLKCLKTLRLSSTAVTDRGIRKLQALKKLRTLTLHDSLVSKDCCVQLGKFMPKCEIRWSAHEEPKPSPAHLPRLLIRDQPRSDWDPGWYLKLVADTYKIKIEDVKIRARPNTWIAVSNFKPSQPPWFELIEWECTPRDS